MSETTDPKASQGDNEMEPIQRPDELAMLKQQARLMGIAFSNNIGIETLRAKIQEHMAASEEAEPVEPESPVEPVEAPVAAKPVQAPAKKKTLRQKLLEENMRLIRLRIMNLDPKKRGLPGEIFTVANEYIGTVKKFVPYGEVSDEGYHVPYCIYKQLKAREFLDIQVRKKNGREEVETRWAKEFALEELPPLTPEELRQLAVAQLAAGNS